MVKAHESFDSHPPLRACFPEPASAVMFAREFGCPEILPAAFYQLARTPITRDWDSVDDSPTARPARWALVDSADFRRFVTGCDRLHKFCDPRGPSPPALKGILAIHCAPYRISQYPDEDVEAIEADEADNSYVCYETILKSFAHECRAERHRFGLDPLKWLNACLDHKKTIPLDRPDEHVPCSICYQGLNSYVTAERKFVWASLPHIIATDT